MNRYIAIAAAGLIAAPAFAQQSQAAPSFDLLRAAHSADSLRTVSARQRAELAKLQRAAAARADTIARQQREIVALRATRVAIDSPSVMRVAVTKTARDTVPAVVRDVVTPRTVPVAPPTDSVKATRTPPAVAAPAARAAFPTTPAINGMLQFWMTAGDQGFRNGYRLRRAEVKASGSPTARIAWTVVLDFAKSLSASSTTTSSGSVQTAVSQTSRALQDANVVFLASPSVRVAVGQQKVPFGMEGFASSSTIEMVERALFASDRARGGSFGDTRDLGVAVRGVVGPSLDYHVGVFNGSGESQNDVDANLAKAVIARVLLRPHAALQLGASGVYAGNGAGDAPRRDREAVEVRVKRGRLLVQTEAVQGHDASILRRGAYLHAGYRIVPSLDLRARVDAWDPDVRREADLASATERDYLVGATWLVPSAGVKLQGDVARRTWSALLAPSRWELRINLQTSW